MSLAQAVPQPADSGLSFFGFVSLLAALMAVNAIGIDAMLPALSQMSQELGMRAANDRQWVVTAYVIGLGVAQLGYGPLADRFGRKPVLVLSTAAAGLFAILGGVAASFETIIFARLMQGVAAAGSRVLVVAVVRDCCTGPQMARVMSITLLILLAVPVFAPSLGQAILVFAGWRAIFFAMGGFALVCALATALLLKETLQAEHRRPFSLATLAGGAKVVVLDKDSRTYSLAGALAFGLLIGYITCAQQVFESFGASTLFPIAFAGLSLFLGIGTLANARLVRTFGMRRISHTALLLFTAISALHLSWAMSGHETLVSFIAFQALAMTTFALIGPNFGTIAMGQMGPLAGSAASIQGFVTTVGGAVVGTLIGHAFNGTVIPLVAGFVIVGVATTAILVAGTRREFWKRGEVDLGPPPG